MTKAEEMKVRRVFSAKSDLCHQQNKKHEPSKKMNSPITLLRTNTLLPGHIYISNKQRGGKMSME